MNMTSTRAPGLTVVLTAHAHADADGRLLLAELTADAASGGAPPAQVALVVDRSGSMSGPKLAVCRTAVAAFVRSLRPEDRLALVVYDDEVTTLSRAAAPSETLARAVEAVEPGGSTNLYGGWIAGARLLAPGGRVVLLSDGQANAGAHTDAASLARHAGLSYERYRITTTTIGVGADYDEALMAGMARAGGGGHYYAGTAEAILDALNQERFSLGAVAQSHVSLRLGDRTVALGHLWGGETKRTVLRVDGLDGPPATVRATLAATGVTTTTALEMPRDFGHSDDATLEVVLQDAARAEGAAAEVRDPRGAAAARADVRAVLLRLLAHPLADGELATAVRLALEGALARLERLERRYDEREATVHRKRSLQSVHNLADRAKAYSSFDEDAGAVLGFVAAASAPTPAGASEPDPDARALLTDARWAELPALPVGLDGEVLVVALENPRDGFLVAAIEREAGRRVRPVPTPMPAEAIRRALDE